MLKKTGQLVYQKKASELISDIYIVLSAYNYALNCATLTLAITVVLLH